MSAIGIAQNIARSGSFRSRAATHAGTAGRNNEDAYLKAVQAPVGVKPVLKAWMELT